MNGFNLSNPYNRNLYNALCGKEVQKEGFWPEFKASAERRNKIIHNSFIATKSQGDDSVKAAIEVVKYLK